MVGVRFSTRAGKLVRLVRTFRNWPTVLLDHLGLYRGSYVCRLRDGTSFEVRAETDDRHVLFEIYVEDIYRAEIAPGDVVVDIGANIGGFTVLAARQGARVVAFEPFPANFDALRRNVDRNGGQITLVQAAVADEGGAGKLYLPDVAAFTGRYSLHAGRGSATVAVRCISLDDAFRDNQLDRIDFLKIDCQGSEYQILYGASPETLAKVKSIVVECEHFVERLEWTTPAMLRFLESQGFLTRSSGNLVWAKRVSEPPLSTAANLGFDEAERA